jgi:hypothetical protein
MQLLYFDDEANMEAELKCLEDWNRGMIKFDKKEYPAYFSSKKATLKVDGGRWMTSGCSIGCENRYFFCPNPKGLAGPAAFKNSSRWCATILFATETNIFNTF